MGGESNQNQKNPEARRSGHPKSKATLASEPVQLANSEPHTEHNVRRLELKMGVLSIPKAPVVSA